MHTLDQIPQDALIVLHAIALNDRDTPLPRCGRALRYLKFHDLIRETDSLGRALVHGPGLTERGRDVALRTGVPSWLGGDR